MRKPVVLLNTLSPGMGLIFFKPHPISRGLELFKRQSSQALLFGQLTGKLGNLSIASADVSRGGVPETRK